MVCWLFIEIGAADDWVDRYLIVSLLCYLISYLYFVIIEFNPYNNYICTFFY